MIIILGVNTVCQATSEAGSTADIHITEGDMYTITIVVSEGASGRANGYLLVQQPPDSRFFLFTIFTTTSGGS